MKKLNFGCGTDIKVGFDNVDKRDFDFNRFYYPIGDNYYDYIYSHHVLEHLENPERVLNELCRIAKPNATIKIIVPHFNCEGAFAELGHISYFVPATFNSFANPPSWRNQPYKIQIIKLKSIPTSFGKWIPFRRKMSLILRGIYKEIEFKFKVIKSGIN